MPTPTAVASLDSRSLFCALFWRLLLCLLCFSLTPGPALLAMDHHDDTNSPPTVEEAIRFIAAAEEKLLASWIHRDRNAWVQSTYITPDTEILAAQAEQQTIQLTLDLIQESRRYIDLDLPYDVKRKLGLLLLDLTLSSPRDPQKSNELSALTASMLSTYGRGRYCPPGGGDCLSEVDVIRTLRESRDPARLLEVWQGWHAIAKPIRPEYARYVELANEGAKELGFADLGALWRSKYDMDPDAFAAELDRLWGQVRPLYDALHCYVRGKLHAKYGAAIDPQGPLPAHLLGNLWAQDWGNIFPLVAPANSDPGYDVGELLKAQQVDEIGMVRHGERFFTSLGFAPLPKTFWERSLFVKPRDRDVVCHASAWDVSWNDDLRIKMCIEINSDDFDTIHHELGHNFYFQAYNHLSTLYRQSANDGFHEAVGDTIALSVTPKYLQQIGLLKNAPDSSADIGLLLRKALEKVAFLPFSLVIDQWRWQVFSGKITPAEYNQAWWDLRLKYQGVQPPVARSEADFDPGAKYHVPGNVPYTRYFLAHILQFQFHRELCRAAGETGPLHRCSIYGSTAAGQRLRNMLAMGVSRPWPDALEALTGSRQMDATAILDYFAPLKAWLDEQNQGQTCGWQAP